MHDEAEKARMNIEVPWDDVRAARVHRAALEEFRKRNAVKPEEPSRLASLKRALTQRWILAAAALLLVVALVPLGLSGSGLFFGSGSSEAGDDNAPTAAQPGWGATSALEFADGSRSLLSEHAKVQVVEDATEHVAVRQSAGRVRYEVAPRQERRFEVRVRNVTVTVVGTVFDVALEGDKVLVSVERGRVRVAHREREVVLGPGERVTIDADGTEARSSVDVPSKRADASEDEQSKADDAKDAKDSAQRVPTAAALLRRADEARASGRFEEAISALRTLIAEHPRDRRVTHALFSIGQIERQRGRHAAAAQAFEQCGNALQGDAIAEAATAWSAAGRGDRARAAALRYLAAFPEGVHAERMRALSGGS
jgi:hypothetical protein